MLRLIYILITFFLMSSISYAGVYISPLAGENFIGDAELTQTEAGFRLNINKLAAKRLLLKLSSKPSNSVSCQDTSTFLSTSFQCSIEFDRNFNLIKRQSIIEKNTLKLNGYVDLAIRSPEVEIWRGQSQLNISGPVITDFIIKNSKGNKIVRTTSPDFTTEIYQTGNVTCIQQTKMNFSKKSECFLSLNDILDIK